MLLEIFIGLFVSLSFLFGIILYRKTKEELQPIVKKLPPVFNKLAFLLAGLLGLVLSVFVLTEHGAIVSIGVFASGLVLGSLALTNDDKAVLFKHSIETVITFLAIYFAVLVFSTL